MMKKRTVWMARSIAMATLIAFSLSGCGERAGQETEPAPVQTEKVTEKNTEKETTVEAATEHETESETQQLITSVDYTSKDGTIKITLPDNTWKVTQDADEMRVFQSGNAAIINIVHANTDTAMKNLSVMTTEDELKASLSGQYSAEDAFEIEDFISTEVNGVDIYRYTVKYNAAARMWAYSVTNAVVAQEQAYVVTGTVTDDNDTLLESVKKSVESFRVLKDEELKQVTGEVITGKTQTPTTTQNVDTSTASGQELTSLTDYGTTATLVTTDTVNVRAQPGTDAGILTTLNGQTSVTVVGETRNWFKVNINGNIGYIRKDFLVYGNTATTTQTEPEADAGTGHADESTAEASTATNYGSPVTLYASSDVNIRTQPGTDSAVAGSLAAGTAVSVIGETDNWFIVSIGGNTEYISKAFLTYDNSGANGVTADTASTTGDTSSGTASTSAGSPSAISGTVVGTTVDTLTVQGDDGNTYTVYYGDANTTSADGLYSGVYVSVSLDSTQAAGDGTLYATGVTGY